MNQKYFTIRIPGNLLSDAAGCNFPILWKNLPSELKKRLPEYFLENLFVVESNGELKEKTFVYLQEVEFDEDLTEEMVLRDCQVFDGGNINLLIDPDSDEI